MIENDKEYRPSLAQNAFRWLYSLLLALIIPFAFVNLMIRGQQRNKEYNRRRFERFGFVSRPEKPNGYLFHCVSVGEVVAASVLIKRIMQQEPDTPITVTTTTPTGSARVRAIFGTTVHHFYLPYDLHMAMAGMLKRVRPKMVLITEVELWPNLIHCCWRRNVPVVVVNARMTTRSARRYKKVGLLFTPMLQKISHVCAQGQRDFDNYLFLGMNKNKLTLTNNIKFDQAMVAEQADNAFHGIAKGQRSVLIGGSTHEGEEAALLNAFTTLKPVHTDLLLILVPRHPERFAGVKKLIASHNVNFICSSEGGSINSDTDVLLVDEMGKLNQAYTVGDVAFVGGSLVDKGGHNALEPAANHLPVIMGSYTYNNPIICQYLQESGALVCVDSAEALTQQCAALFADRQRAMKAGEAGFAVLAANQGAVDKTLQVIRHCNQLH